VRYAVELGPAAEEDLRRLPPDVQAHVANRLHDLEQSPTRVSRPSHFPYSIDGQAFKFDYRHQQTHYYFHVLFKYGQDEQTIHVELIGVMRVELDASDDE
jgi:hypothetical protein